MSKVVGYKPALDIDIEAAFYPTLLYPEKSGKMGDP